MFIDDDSLLFVEEHKAAEKDLKPLFDQYRKIPLPPLKLRVRLDKEKKLWMTYLLVGH